MRSNLRSTASSGIRPGTLFLYLLLAYATPGHAVTYADLAPILTARCTLCHAGEAAPLGLRLDSLDGLLLGSTNGPVVAPGDPGASELIRRLKGDSLPRMPMTGPPFLSASEIALFEDWVAGGLQRGTAADVAAPAPTAAPRPAAGEPVSWVHVAPIFATRCAKCHTEKGLMGPAPEGYRLTSYEDTLAAFDRARVVPGLPNASELLRRIRGQARPRMPFDGPPYLDDGEIGLIEDWIEDGARNAAGEPAPLPTGAKLRLHGSLESRWQLDGLPLAIGAGTRIDKSPAPGDYVEVRGRLGPGPAVLVERLRRR